MSRGFLPNLMPESSYFLDDHLLHPLRRFLGFEIKVEGLRMGRTSAKIDRFPSGTCIPRRKRAHPEDHAKHSDCDQPD
jgi:hypothetical protein